MRDFHDAGHGYDELGLHPPSVLRALALAAPFYDRYFRVESRGSEQVPRTGPAILVANHSGVLPVDGAMLWVDVARKVGRIARMAGDHFIATMPFVSAAFARVGVVAGTHATVRRLLTRGELLAIFPEGTAGVAKPSRERYHLQRWQVGHAELAIRHRAPIIPVAIVGAEESWPLAFRLRWPRPFGAPYLPVPWTPLPWPVRYHLRYGAPLELFRDHPPEEADDPVVVANAARRTKEAVRDLLDHALAERRS
ncbi:MAG TPA: lysophospholipid acyltransferase family protein [Kofleriaceae bacterium]|nr:lysophospholipid acyltransferase family protein [Kofleriaceae bacterium]